MGVEDTVGERHRVLRIESQRFAIVMFGLFEVPLVVIRRSHQIVIVRIVAPQGDQVPAIREQAVHPSGATTNLDTAVEDVRVAIVQIPGPIDTYDRCLVVVQRLPGFGQLHLGVGVVGSQPRR